jgi:hypothetical protein
MKNLVYEFIDFCIWYREHFAWKYYSWIAPTLHGKTYPAEKFDVMQVSGMQKLIQRQLNEGDLILNTIFYGSLTWLRSPRLSSVPVVSVSALTWFITYPRLYYHHLVDHFGTWTISLRRYHLSIKSVLRHGYGLLDILIF